MAGEIIYFSSYFIFITFYYRFDIYNKKFYESINRKIRKV